MKTKLLPLLPLTALTIAALEISPLAFAQTEVPPMPTPTPAAQATPKCGMKLEPKKEAESRNNLGRDSPDGGAAQLPCCAGRRVFAQDRHPPVIAE
jgi:hypothetical protein